MMGKVTKAVDHNRYKFASALVVIVSAGMLLFASCTPKTDSLLMPGMKVTGVELEVEVQEIQAGFSLQMSKAELAVADLQAQAERNTQLAQLATSLGSAALQGGLTPGTGIAAFAQFAAIFGLGAVADGVRKDKVIAKKKTA